jgi:hypothetical protein
MIWVHFLACALIVLLLPKQAQAKIYSCTGPDGRTVLTDQPKGKQGCTLVETPSPSPPGGFTPPVEAAPAPAPDLPPNVFAPSLPASPMSPRQPGLGEPPLPHTGSQAAGEKAAPEAQRCSPRVNPLNPFAGMNCPPASGNTPEDNKKP